MFKSYSTITVNKHVPIVEKYVRGRSNPWLTRELKDAMHIRDNYLKRYKISKLDDDWDRYKRQRNLVTRITRSAKANHIRKTLTDSQGDPSSFWKNIKSCYPTKKSTISSKSLLINGELTSNKLSIANAFCSFFTQIATKLMNSFIVNLTWKTYNFNNYLMNINPTQASFKFKPVTLEQVLKVLKSIKTSKLAGIDTLPGRIIKDISNEIAARSCS